MAEQEPGRAVPVFGTYTLANDAIVEMFESLCRSFRFHNPAMPMTVIPFDDDCTKVAEICQRYGLVLASGEFDRYDEIGRNWRATRYGTGIFRKFYVFDGPYEQFLFIDADSTILGDLAPFDGILDEHQLDLAYYARPAKDRNLKAPEIKALAALMGDCPEGINDAFFLSRRGALSCEFMLQLSTRADRLKALLVGPANEQALLSYAVVTSGLKFRCLADIASELTPQWDWKRPIQRKDGGFYYRNMAKPRPLRVLHWGAVNWNTGPNQWLIGEFGLHQPCREAAALLGEAAADLASPIEIPQPPGITGATVQIDRETDDPSSLLRMQRSCNCRFDPISQEVKGVPLQFECVIAENTYGLYCIPSGSRHRRSAAEILKGQIWEPQTIRTIVENCGDGDIVHAGMYFGDFLPGISSAMHESAKLWGFEPNPENFQAALITCRLNGLRNVVSHPLGLGKETAKHDLVISRQGTSLGGGSQIVHRAPHATESVVQVASAAIDDIIPRARRVSVIQLAVEGYEEFALAGAIETIRRWHPLIILEMYPKRWIENNLVPLGYEIKGKCHANTILSM